MQNPAEALLKVSRVAAQLPRADLVEVKNSGSTGAAALHGREVSVGPRRSLRRPTFFRRQEDRYHASANPGARRNLTILEEENGAVAFTANDIIEATVRIMAPNGPSDDARFLPVERKAIEALPIPRNIY